MRLRLRLRLEARLAGRRAGLIPRLGGLPLSDGSNLGEGAGELVGESRKACSFACRSNDSAAMRSALETVDLPLGGSTTAGGAGLFITRLPRTMVSPWVATQTAAFRYSSRGKSNHNTESFKSKNN